MTYHPDPYVRDYDDRKMAKWLGFYLSEHTAQMQCEQNQRNRQQPLKKNMSVQEISQALELSFNQQKTVAIQLNYLNSEKQPSADIIGIVKGMQENQLYLLQTAGKMLCLELDSVKHAKVLH